jgi:hypothetical protein
MTQSVVNSVVVSVHPLDYPRVMNSKDRRPFSLMLFFLLTVCLTSLLGVESSSSPRIALHQENGKTTVKKDYEDSLSLSLSLFFCDCLCFLILFSSCLKCVLILRRSKEENSLQELLFTFPFWILFGEFAFERETFVDVVA